MKSSKTADMRKLRVWSFILLLAIAFSPVAKAQVLNTQSFDGTAFIPLGWSPVNSGSNYWTRSTNGTTPTTTPHSGAAMASFVCVSGGAVSGAPAGLSQTIATPAFDLTGITANDTAHVSLWMYRNGSASTNYDSINIMVNTTLDTTGAVVLGTIARCRLIAIPDTFNVSAWHQYTFAIPASFNGPTNYLMIRATSQAGNNMYIDDVSWESFPPACTGTPTAGTISVVDTLLCGGSGSTTLLNTGATQNASGVTYQWQSAPSPTGPWTDFGTGVANENTGVLTATTWFRYLVTCTSSGLYDSTNVAQVTVNPNPLPVLSVPNSPLTLCLPSVTGVTLTASGANTYSWSPATGLSSTTGDSITANPTQTTTYTVTGTDAFGCTATATVSVQPRNAPFTNVTTNDSILCPGQTTNLTAQSGGGPGFGNTYAWLPGGETTQQVTASPVNSTMYYCTITNQSGCSRTDSLFVEVTAGVTADFTYTVNGHTVTFTNTSGNATTAFWTFGDGNMSGNLNPTYTYSADGTYDVTLIAGNGICNNDTIVYTINININGLPSNEFGAVLSVKPNPVSDFTTIAYSIVDPTATLELSDINGKAISMVHITGGAGTRTQLLDMKSLNAGVYICKISSAHFNQAFRVIRK